MKYILSFFLTLSVLCTSLSAVEYGYISNDNSSTNPNYLVLNTGDIMEYIGYAASQENIYIFNNSLNTNLVSTALGGWDWSALSEYLIGTHLIFNHTKSFICGPVLVALETDNAFVSYKLTRASEVEYKNVNIVALPAATVGAGTHEIVVEASDDLQTWTPVHSSSIGGSKAFFRTRVVEVGE
jgi:hypothetical protein